MSTQTKHLLNIYFIFLLQISNVPKPCATKPFYGETQFHADFPPERAWNSVNPMYSNVVQPCQPPKAQIQLHQTNERYFHTEQRDQFQRHDVKCNPKSFKHEAPPYTRPSIKLDCYSVTKLDFQPYTPEQILNVNPKLKFGRKIIKNGEGDQPGKLKSQEMRLLKKYLQDLKSAKGQQIPKM
ncbi:unnamed protein product [Trichobilharzia regenti]|nr:unnamed protein product [Trichobilharzia regenti]